MNFNDLLPALSYHEHLYYHDNYTCSETPVDRTNDIEFTPTLYVGPEPREAESCVATELRTGFYCVGYTTYHVLITNRRDPRIRFSISWQNYVTLTAQGSLDTQQLGVVCHQRSGLHRTMLVPAYTFEAVKQRARTQFSIGNQPATGQYIKMAATGNAEYVYLYSHQDKFVYWDHEKAVTVVVQWAQAVVFPGNTQSRALDVETMQAVAAARVLNSDHRRRKEDSYTPLGEQTLTTLKSLTALFELSPQIRLGTRTQLIMAKTRRECHYFDLKLYRRKDGKYTATFRHSPADFGSKERTVLDNLSELAQWLQSMIAQLHANQYFDHQNFTIYVQ